MSEKRQRRHVSPEEKIKILREHFEKKRAVSELCEQYSIDPGQFSQWKKTFFEEGAQVFASRAGRRRGPTADELKVQKTVDEIKRLQEVVAELAAENIELKKRTGRS